MINVKKVNPNDYREPEDDHEKLMDKISLAKLNLMREIFEVEGYDLGDSPAYVAYHNYLADDIITLLPSGVGGFMNFGDLSSFDASKYANASLANISLEELSKIFKGANKAYLGACISILSQYGSKIGLSDYGKLFILAQMAVESGNFRYFKEIGEGKGKPYGIPKPPYNKIYYGRGPIQITHDYNYKAITEKCFPKLGLNINIYANPELCEQNLEIACLSSLCWFMLGGNGRLAVQYANAGNVSALTKMINGGYSHLEERMEYTKKILQLANISR